MTSETRTCRNCKQNFVIEAEDFAFYERMKVPAPTWCPECRLIRRLMWRNERTLHKRKCALCGKATLANYAADAPAIVYCQSCWWSDKWDPLTYGRTYDFSKPFFLQFLNLFHTVPVPALWGFNNVNCDYANYLGYSKNCYLSFSIVECEDIYYSSNIDRSRHCLDCDFLTDAELCYQNSNSSKNYRSMFLVNTKECIDCAFLYDCSNCKSCFMSNNLRNKQYVFSNRQYSKDEYEEKIKEIDFGDYISLTALIEQFEVMRRNALYKFANILKSVNASGDELSEVKNAHYCFRVHKSEDVKYCWRIVNDFKNAYDVSGAFASELVYEGTVAANYNYMGKFYSQYHHGKDFEYCIYGDTGSHLFGCVGIRSKQYCFLNRQYPKEEYEKLVPRIVEHMNSMPYVDKLGRVYKYGEFFPPELSPFAYNETIAQEYFPLTKEKAIEQGYTWKEPEERNYNIQITNDKLPDHIRDVGDDIVDKVIECQHKGECNEQCTTAFKIIPQELQFYKKMNLPLPRLCPNCRHYQRLKQRNPLKLWHRQCMCDYQIYSNTAKHHHPRGRCPNEFETSYSPDRKEIIYCEQCYNSEVA